jgi:hypothetical protein
MLTRMTAARAADLLEATVPAYVRPNFCDYIRSSRFESRSRRLT